MFFLLLPALLLLLPPLLLLLPPLLLLLLLLPQECVLLCSCPLLLSPLAGLPHRDQWVGAAKVSLEEDVQSALTRLVSGGHGQVTRPR